MSEIFHMKRVKTFRFRKNSIQFLFATKAEQRNGRDRKTTI